jgi:hypothetical protein
MKRRNHNLNKFKIIIMRKLQLLLAIFTLTFITSCTPDEEPLPLPITVLTVTTDIPTGITNTQVTLGGNVLTDGGNAVIDRGVCISLTVNPTIDDPTNDDVLPIGSGIGVFAETYTGFPASTTVHVRAYATNSLGTVYGEDRVFTTLAGSTACPIVNVTGNITTPTTWTTGNVYVVNAQIAITSVLTIQPGVIIKLDSNGNIRVNSGGKILANGTSTNRIVFTSIADDTYCGDTNGDGAATTPQKGDWLNLYLNGGTGHVFNYCDFFYAGANDGGYRAAVIVSVAGPSFTFDNCTFAHTANGTNFTGGFAFYAGSYMSDSTVSVFTNNVFYDNYYPIYLSATYSINANNSYSNPVNPSEKNARNCIWMYPEAGNNIAVTLGETEVPYVMDGYLQKSTGSMTFGAGVVMKFPIGNTYGLNVASLSLNSSAFLTSIKDDAHGGDTNGDGSATAPANNDWYGYYNWTSSSWVHGANILYAAN